VKIVWRRRLGVGREGEEGTVKLKKNKNSTTKIEEAKNTTTS
jgi:hypothetical protein